MKSLHRTDRTLGQAVQTLASRVLIACAIATSACGGDDNTNSNVSAPGEPKTPKTVVLETGAAMLQNKPPIEAINSYLDGFHFYSGKLQAQMEAHHYCSILNEDVIQCVIYDGNVRNAKLMGVEYIVSEKVFKGFPKAEKALWHSHVHEVKSGQLIAPNIPEVAETESMKKLVSTYGKTWHTWHTDMDQQLPLGVPQLMMGFTADGQIDPSLVAARDQRFGISSFEKRKARGEIDTPTVDADADGGIEGRAFQISGQRGSPHAHGSKSTSASRKPDGTGRPAVKP